MVFKSNLMMVTPIAVLGLLLAPALAYAQFNSGSDGHDGALNAIVSTTIDMADHPDGIYQYTSVSISAGATVSFMPNAANTPVVWLIQGDCTINGLIDVAGKSATRVGGPGGGRGGEVNSAGMGPGAGGSIGGKGGNASYATLGSTSSLNSAPGILYGNDYLIPLLGGSGGGGAGPGYKGGAGGGALLIACNGVLSVNGTIDAQSSGTNGGSSNGFPGDGSGGAVRLMASTLQGNGGILANCRGSSTAGKGRVRLEAYSDLYTGYTTGVVNRGMQGIILLPRSLNPHLRVSSIGGVAAPATPIGSLPAADVVLSGASSSPFEVVVGCENIPLNTPITVDVKPQQAATISVAATNSSGTFESSTATASVDIPVGGGTISAKAVITIVTGGEGGLAKMSYRDTGLTTSGERFKLAEVTTTLGGRQQITYITEKGKRISLGQESR